MKLSHRLIREQFHRTPTTNGNGNNQTTTTTTALSPRTTSSQSQSRPSTSPSHINSLPLHSTLHPMPPSPAPKLVGLHDGLDSHGLFALGGGRVKPPLTAASLATARPATAANPANTTLVYRPSAPPPTARPSTTQPRTRSHQNALMELTSHSATPRITQAANLKRLSTGQSIVHARNKKRVHETALEKQLQTENEKAEPTNDQDEAAGHEWTYLTTVRKRRERAQRLREARVFVQNETRMSKLNPSAEYTLDEEERLRQLQLDRQLPPKSGMALASTKKSRRPPGQCVFHDVSLSEGILAKITRTSNVHYRLSQAIPGSLTLADEPRLVAWRLDTNSWLTQQQKYVAKQVSVSQMSELRVLYDALDDDGSDSLDASELATAMEVCGIDATHSKTLAVTLLEWMGKSRFDTLSFAEFAYAVLHYEIPVGTKGNYQRAAFGVSQRMQPLYKTMMDNDSRASFSQVVLEFKRHRLYQQMHKTTGVEFKYSNTNNNTIKEEGDIK